MYGWSLHMLVRAKLRGTDCSMGEFPRCCESAASSYVPHLDFWCYCGPCTSSVGGYSMQSPIARKLSRRALSHGADCSMGECSVSVFPQPWEDAAGLPQQHSLTEQLDPQSSARKSMCKDHSKSIGQYVPGSKENVLSNKGTVSFPIPSA